MNFFLVKVSSFNEVIEIEDNFDVNSFLKRLSCNDKQYRVKDLNSIFIKHMFSRTENPSDSEISPDYMERIHETGAILLDFSEIIRAIKESGNIKSSGFKSFSNRMENLIDLINAEKFDFEDLHAWRMGSKMETMFRERWKILSDEFSKLKISLNNRIRQNKKVSGKISTIGEIQQNVDIHQDEMIRMQEDSIRAIRDLELEQYFKERLIRQLNDQIRNESRDLKMVLIDLFHQYEHEMKRKKGKFSNSSLKKKIIDLIESENAIENISERELLEKFDRFWNEIIENSEIMEFRKSIERTQKEQSVKYRDDLKKGFEACFENDQFDIVANQAFQYLKSIEEWDFTEEQFKKIKIMGQNEYFEKDMLKRFVNFISKSSKNHKNFMPQLLYQFNRLLNENPYTKKDYDGFVDNQNILDLCTQFEGAFSVKINEFELTSCIKPLFKVRVIGFACFKLLLPRLQQNLSNYQTTRDPVQELNAQKDYFINLYRSKVNGAKHSVLWEQKLTFTLLELVVEIVLNPVGSQETHDFIYKFISQKGSNRNRKTSIKSHGSQFRIVEAIFLKFLFLITKMAELIEVHFDHTYYLL